MPRQDSTENLEATLKDVRENINNDMTKMREAADEANDFLKLLFFSWPTFLETRGFMSELDRLTLKHFQKTLKDHFDIGASCNHDYPELAFMKMLLFMFDELEVWLDVITRVTSHAMNQMSQFPFPDD